VVYDEMPDYPAAILALAKLAAGWKSAFGTINEVAKANAERARLGDEMLEEARELSAKYKWLAEHDPELGTDGKVAAWPRLPARLEALTVIWDAHTDE
jgi:hypothetical protein